MAQNFNFTPNLVIDENIEIQRIRELPLSGILYVKDGDYINNDEVIAKTTIQGDLVILRASKELGLEPKDFIDSYLVNINDTVKKGDTLIRKKGLFNIFNSEYKSKYDGKIEILSKETGNIGIRLKSKDFSLYSYLSGKIIECKDNKFIKILTRASLIQGVFGIGGEKTGILKNFDDSVSEDKLKNAIVFYDNAPNIELLQKLLNYHVKGLIVPSISSNTLKDFLGYDIGIAVTGDENIDMTIVITEGFGKMKFNPKIVKILNKNLNKRASISGVTQIRAGAIRPEVIIFNNLDEINYALDNPKTNGVKNNSLEVGTNVKILKNPYFGRFGVITKIYNDEIQFESGITCRGVEILLDDNQTKVVVPKANTQVI